MAPTVQDILRIIETIAPECLAESWDNTGLMIGDPANPVKTILVGLDPTLSLLHEAQSLKADLIITHHPIIFHPLKSIHLGQPNGKFIDSAIRTEINIISSHTNLDSAHRGISDILARLLGLKDITPLVPQESGESGCGLGRVGTFAAPLSSQEFLERLRSTLTAPWLLGTGQRPEQIKKVAVCGGSCSDLAKNALAAGAQVFVTAEVKHNIALWAEESGLWIIDAGHFATENIGIRHFAEQLATATANQFDNISIRVTEQQTSPLNLM